MEQLYNQTGYSPSGNDDLFQFPVSWSTLFFLRSMPSHLDVAAKAASYNVLLQVALRASTFLLNGFILRFIQAELLGVVNLRLTLLYNSILFLSREALRKACLSQTTQEKKWCHVFNLMWCSIPLGLLSSSLLCALWVSPYIEQPSSVPGDPLGVLVFAAAALIELTAEPLWVMGQLHQYVSLKVIAEGLPQMFRCAVVVSGVLLAPQWGLAIFCVAQLAYSLGYVAIYYIYFSNHLRSHVQSRDSHMLPIRGLKDTLPNPDGAKQWFNPYLTQLSWSFFKQSLLKQLLTDGEKYVMTIFGVLTFAEQGIYDVINNLGSLAARFIFLPIEESFYVFFASTLYRGEPVEKQKQTSIPLTANTLSMLIKLVLLVALVILSFGYAYSYLALDIYGGKLLSEGGGPNLLRWYCVYVLLLAVNGVTECFVFAAMSQAQVDRYNRSMVVFSLIFLSTSLFLTRVIGSVGFILANCINMAARIIHSCRFIHTFFSSTPHSPLHDAVPSLYTLAAFLASFVLTATSEAYLCCNSGWLHRLAHIGIGAVLLFVTGAVVFVTEPQLVRFLVERMPVESSATSRWFARVVAKQQTVGTKKKKK